MDIMVPREVEPPITLLGWHLREGEAFRAGESLVDLIGPEGCHSVLAATDGLLTEIYVADGCAVRVGEALARIEVA